MKRTKIIEATGLTFDDVLLLPSYSDVLPREVDTSIRLAGDIVLKVPMISAAMDTVTEGPLAIAIGREGGLGIIHKNMTIDAQADHVRRVKRAENGLILDPVTLGPDDTIGRALETMRMNKIGGIPIVTGSGKLVGIITNRDLRFLKPDKHKLKIREYMTKKLVTAPKSTTLPGAKRILEQHKLEKLPVVDGEGKLVGLFTFKDSLQGNKPNACRDSDGQLFAGAAIGITADILARVEALIQAGVDIITLDSAHGHSKGVLDAVKKVKKEFPKLPVIAGNIATADGAKALAQAGADVVKVGVGPGSICTTRVVTGCGAPQLTAIMDAARALKGTGIPVIADGGIRYTGDMVKALAAGASAIMAGSIFAGTEESPGETIIFEGRKFKSYRGMGSVEAMQDGSKDRYFQDMEADIKKLVPEGIVGRVPYKGELSEVMQQFVGGLRSGMGYVGCKDIPTLWKNAQFTRITAASMAESHPHDVFITKEAPNYSKKS